MCCNDSRIADYVNQQDEIERLHSSAAVHNDDFVGIASYNIFVGIAVATIFGAGFFFDLFFPERYEPKNIRWSWRISALVVTLMAFADAIALTVIVATGNAWISADTQDAADIARQKLSPPLRYRDNGRAIASVVFLWVGLVGTVARYVGCPVPKVLEHSLTSSAASSYGFTTITLTHTDQNPTVLECGMM